jgi:hypothetical protein
MASARNRWPFLALFGACSLVVILRADEVQPIAPPLHELAVEPADAFTPSAGFQEWITALARDHIPTEYEKKRNWGHTTKSFDGVSVRVENGQLRTHRKFREANDGKWQMYRIKLADPNSTFDVRIANLRELPNGRVGMEITAVADLDVFGRQSLWEHGVQLFSLSAEATARVRLWAYAEVATRLDPTRIPPDVILDPEVKAAKLDIPDFRLRRVGELDGPLVRSLSHATREVLEEKLREDNAKLVASLNKQIAKQEKKLRLSLVDVLQSKWGKLLNPVAGTKPGPGESP